ncbi:hypothetical protein GCM10022221_41430 [Actinocorallia aurea]
MTVKLCNMVLSTFLARTIPPYRKATPGVMNSTSAELASTHAVAPESTVEKSKGIRNLRFEKPGAMVPPWRLCLRCFM